MVSKIPRCTSNWPFHRCVGHYKRGAIKAWIDDFTHAKSKQELLTYIDELIAYMHTSQSPPFRKGTLLSYKQSPVVVTYKWKRLLYIVPAKYGAHKGNDRPKLVSYSNSFIIVGGWAIPFQILIKGCKLWMEFWNEHTDIQKCAEKVLYDTLYGKQSNWPSPKKIMWYVCLLMTREISGWA